MASLAIFTRKLSSLAIQSFKSFLDRSISSTPTAALRGSSPVRCIGSQLQQSIPARRLSPRPSRTGKMAEEGFSYGAKRQLCPTQIVVGRSCRFAPSILRSLVPCIGGPATVANGTRVGSVRPAERYENGSSHSHAAGRCQVRRQKDECRSFPQTAHGGTGVPRIWKNEVALGGVTVRLWLVVRPPILIQGPDATLVRVWT